MLNASANSEYKGNLGHKPQFGALLKLPKATTCTPDIAGEIAMQGGLGTASSVASEWWDE